MELILKHFRELTLDELADIYRLRVSVFVVEQNCPYQEIDAADKTAYHLYLKDENGIQSGRCIEQRRICDECFISGRDRKSVV